MTSEQKQSIITAALQYMKEKKLSQTEMSRLSHINTGYLSLMLRGDFTSGNTVIEKRYFIQLAKACDFKWNKAYWQSINTTQFPQIIGTLQDAKSNSTTATIIGTTGAGKTYSVERFCLKYPTETFRITASGHHSLIDIINDLSDAMGLEPVSGSYYRSYAFTKVRRVARIVNKLIELKDEGKEPVVIIDEAENLKVPVLQMLKYLYDGIKGSAALVLIGTPQLLDKLEKLKRKDKEGMPQFYRRVKAGIVHISENISFIPFFEKMVITDKGLRKLLCDVCDNYGELNDYLEPFIKECNEMTKPISEENFRIKYNMPKSKF